MIYVLRFKPVEGEIWIKLGSSKKVVRRLVDTLYSNRHPPALCNRLSKEHCEIIDVYAGGGERGE